MSNAATTRCLSRSRLARTLLVPMLIPVAAFLLQWCFWSVIHPYVWFLFFPAVFLSSWIGGLRGGIIATFLSVGLVWYCFIPPQFSFSLQRPMDFFSIAMFAAMGVLSGILFEHLQKTSIRLASALADVQASNEQLEERVLKRTENLEQTNSQLRLSEERYRTLFESMDEGFCVIEIIYDAGKAVDYRFVEVNPAFEKLTALRQPQGRTVRELVPHHPPHRLDIYDQVARTGESSRADRPIKALERYYDVFAFRVGVGPSCRVAILFNDITQRKLSEDRLRDSESRMNFAMESSHTGAWEFNLQDHSAQRTLIHARIFGYETASPEDWSFEKFIEHVLPEDRPDVVERIRLVSMGLSGSNFDCRIRRADGQIRWIRIAGGLEKNAEGQRIRVSGIVQDITDQKEAAKALEKLSHQRQLVLDAAHLGWWHYDPITQISSWDDRYKEIFGVQGSESPNAEILARLHPEDLPSVWAAVQASLDPKDPQPYMTQYRINHPDGQVHWIEAYGKATFEGEGDARRATSFIGTVMDITDRKAVEEKLLESRAKLQLALASMNDAVFISDATGLQLLDFNEAFATFHRFKDKSECDACLTEYPKIFQVCYPNGDSTPRELWPLRRALRGETATNVEHILKRIDLNVTWVGSYSFAPIRDNAGNIIGAVATARDITDSKNAETALRESETRLRLAVKAANLGLWDWDLENNTVYFSPAWKQQIGYENEEIGNRIEEWQSRVHPDDLEFVLLRQRDFISNPQGQHVSELRLRHKDGSYRWIIALSDVLRNADEKPVRMLGCNLDITERKLTEEKIHELNRTLEQRVLDRTAELRAVNSELESFSYSVSHDLRAPLRHIHGYVEMLTRELGDQLSDKGRRFLKTISDSSGEMGVLIDDLLAFSRMGRVEMRESNINLDSLLKDSIAALEDLSANRNIEWKIPPLPLAKGDAAMLKQVFANLLGNALKYTRPRNPAVIEIGCAGEEDGRHVFFVRDNGVGFDPQYAGKLFGVFQRLHRADEFEGTGIGLASVRRIITRHGGRTWAEGALDKGATFYFTLKSTSTLT